VPELPEVETIARGLHRAISGKTFGGAEVRLPRVVVAKDPRPLGEALAGDQITQVGRRGKFVCMSLASGRSLVVHLRMTGRLIVQARPEPVEAAAPARGEQPLGLLPYANVVLAFTDGSRLTFADARTFGRMRLVEPEEAWAADFGLEPLSRDFSFERFSELLAGRTTPIKVFLLDQRRIAGIGNIYACEALWEARIRPSRPAGKLSKQARQRLHESITGVLRRAIELRGTSVDDYVDADGLRGGYQNRLSVYGRHGQDCPRCGRKIVRTVLAQRGTWSCARCQK
jgi:formamidopyrimidine-DNA glycosylase